MANRYKGEVPFSPAGKGAFIRFSLDDLAELEEAFGRDFFAAIEDAALHASPKDLPKVLAIGLKSRDGEGDAIRIWDTLPRDPLPFKIGDAGKPILEAIAQSHLGKSYDDLIKDAEDARKKLASDAIEKAREAAKEQNVPFEAILPLFYELWGLRTEQGSAPSTSGA